MERAHPRLLDPDDGGDRRDRHLRRVDGRRALHVEARSVGIPWMVFGMAGYFVYRRRQGLSPSKRYRIERAERPADFEELDYRTALVPIFGEDVSATALAQRGEADRRRRAWCTPCSCCRCPASCRWSPGLEDEEAQGRSVLESARIQARRAGIKIHTGLIRTRNPGAALVEEAQRVDADVIYWSTLHAPGGRAAHRPDRHLPAGQRPCRVIIETDNGPAVAWAARRYAG